MTSGFKYIQSNLPLQITYRVFSSLKLVHWDILKVFANNRLRCFPDLNKVILCSTAYHPWLRLVPAEIRKVVGMASVHEESDGLVSSVAGKNPEHLQLRNTIFLIIWQLFFSNSAQIPENHSTIITSTTKNGFFKWMPSK
jgi:hypothetical protein